MSFSRVSALAALVSALVSGLSLCSPVACTAPSEEAVTEDDVTAGTPMTELFAEIPLGTKWADVPPRIQRALARKAENLRRARRKEWGEGALAAKEAVLLEAPTPAMLAYFDQAVRTRFAADVPEAFEASKDVRSAKLLASLKKFYLLESAASRDEAMRDPPPGPSADRIPVLDWDGVTRVREGVLSDEQLIRDHSHYAARILQEVREVLAESDLPPLERHVAEKTANYLRVFAGGVPYPEAYTGGDPYHKTHAVYSFSTYFVFSRTKKGGATFATDDDFLEAMNGLWFGPKLDNVDVGSVKSLLEFHRNMGYGSDAAIKDLVGDPATNVVARATVLMRDWWIERVRTSAEAENRCTILSSKARASIWDVFAATGGLDPSVRLEDVAQQNAEFGAELRGAYGPLIDGALVSLFPEGDVLSATQRAAVVAKVLPKVSFAVAQQQVAAALDEVTGNAAASARFNEAMNAVRYIGYNDPNATVDPADKALIEGMWQEVRSWLGARYDSGPGPHKPGVLLPQTIEITTGATSYTRGVDGVVIIALGGPARTKAGWYSIMLHEALHSFTMRAKLKPEGLAIEGAAQDAERRLLRPFLEHAFAATPEELPLSMLHWGIRDGRNMNTTNATFALLLRKDCLAGEPDSIQLVQGMAKQDGLSGGYLDSVVYRSHWGTQYLQYVTGEIRMRKTLEWLDANIQPETANHFDTYQLISCGLANPRPDPATADKLKACLGL